MFAKERKVFFYSVNAGRVLLVVYKENKTNWISPNVANLGITLPGILEVFLREKRYKLFILEMIRYFLRVKFIYLDVLFGGRGALKFSRI